MSEKGDLISREALLDYIDSTNEIKDWCLNRYSADWIYSFVKSAPAVDAAPVVHGRWERKRSNVYCTACGKGYRVTNGGPNVMTFVYCPMCGARMDGKEDVE